MATRVHATCRHVRVTPVRMCTCARVCMCARVHARVRVISGLSIHYGLTLTHYTLLSFVRDEML